MPSSSIASANKEVKSVLECRSHKPRSQTSSLLSVDRKREVSKLNVGVVLIIAIREISNRKNEFDVNSRNIRPSKITRYTDDMSDTFPLERSGKGRQRQAKQQLWWVQSSLA